MPGNMDAYHSEWADRRSEVEEYPRAGGRGARSDRALERRTRDNISSKCAWIDSDVVPSKAWKVVRGKLRSKWRGTFDRDKTLGPLLSKCYQNIASPRCDSRSFSSYPQRDCALLVSTMTVVSEKLAPALLSNDIHRPSHLPTHFIPMRVSSASSSSSTSSLQSQRYVRPRGLRIWNLFKQWSPILAYGATSLGFVLAIAFWKTEVFDGGSCTPTTVSHSHLTLYLPSFRQVLTNSHTGCETMSTLAMRSCSASFS